MTYMCAPAKEGTVDFKTTIKAPQEVGVPAIASVTSETEIIFK